MSALNRKLLRDLWRLRGQVLAVKQNQYVEAARAMGAGDSRIMTRHVLPNCLMPVITLTGMQIGNLIAFALVTETVFSWPGMGELMQLALYLYDYNTLMGIILIGIIGYFDAVYLPLDDGENDLSLIVTEAFGGWGFMCRDGNAVFTAEEVSGAWQTGGLLTPESVVHDPATDLLYVSNFDGYGRAGPAGSQYVSRVSLTGEVVDR